MSRFIGTIAALCVVMTASQAKAQQVPACRTFYQPTQYPSGYNYYTYQAPKEIVVQKVVAQEVVAAPLVVTVPVASHAVPIHAYGPNHYYSVHESYQQRALIRDVIREELRNFMATQPGAQAPTAYKPPPSVTPQQPAGPTAATDLGPDEKGDPQVVAAFVASCYKCHGGSMGTKGNLRLLYEQNGNYVLAKHGKERRWMIYGQASTGVMPPEAVNDASKALKQEFLPALLKWTVSQ